MASAGDVIAAYLQLREQRDGVVKRHKEELAPFNDKMTKLETFMLDLLNKAGVDSMAFKGVGTMFKKTTQSTKVADWDAVLGWIRANEAWEFLERRVAKSVVQEYSESTGSIPPGVEVTTDTVVQIRKG